MALVVNAFSVITQKAVIEAKYPGGLRAYEGDCGNDTYCADEHICKVSFASFDEAERFAWMMAAAGLTPYQDKVAKDLVIAAEGHGIAKKCAWLECAPRDGQTLAWLRGDGASQTVAMARGSVTLIDIKRTPEAEAIHRAHLAKINNLYEQSRKVLGSWRELPDPPLTKEQSRRLEKVIPIYEALIELEPADWGAMWNLGKALQALRREEQRQFDVFARAHRVNPDEVNVAREAAQAALLVGQNELALQYCLRAVALDPDDSGLRTNLALSLLVNGKVEDARKNALEALRQDPSNDVTQQLTKIVDEVAVGMKPCPRHIDDVR